MRQKFISSEGGAGPADLKIFTRICKEQRLREANSIADDAERDKAIVAAKGHTYKKDYDLFVEFAKLSPNEKMRSESVMPQTRILRFALTIEEEQIGSVPINNDAIYHYYSSRLPGYFDKSLPEQARYMEDLDSKFLCIRPSYSQGNAVVLSQYSISYHAKNRTLQYSNSRI